MKWKEQKILIGLCFLIGFILMLWGVNDPHVGLYNANNNYLALSVKNFFRFGFLNLHLTPTYTTALELPENVPYYLHHPSLFFLITAIPFKVYGFGNWVVHGMTLCFTLAGIGMMYLLASHVFGKRVGLWTSALAIIFPMSGFFYKMMMFEQITLCINLLTLYLFIRYMETEKKRFLVGIAASSFFCMLNDWYGLYLVFVLPVFFFLKQKKAVFGGFLSYLSGVCLGLGIFFLQVSFFGKSGFSELWNAIFIRAVSSELMALPFWGLRYIAVLLLRVFCYFTPLVLLIGFGAIWWKGQKKKRFGLKETLLIALFLLGSLNIIFLPSATWGHSYFLYYFIPFIALTGAIVLLYISKRRVFFLFTVSVILLWSIAIHGLKMIQLQKQLWKHDALAFVSKEAPFYATLGVYRFPGDVLEQYFFHATVPMDLDALRTWNNDESVKPDMLILTCDDECSQEEDVVLSDIRKQWKMTPYTDGGTHRFWIAEREKPEGSVSPGTNRREETQGGENPSFFLRLYRTIRDAFSVPQL